MKTFKEISAIVSTEIEKLNWNKEPIGLYAPISYVLSLGGKRIRPALTLMACNLFTDDIEKAIMPALGIEVFHNFTLLHDDIMDKAPIRRGKPTVHVRWNDNTAILSGDVMQISAYQLISMTPEKHLSEVLSLFSTTAIEICEGQQYDVDFEMQDNVTEEEYMEMIRLKTAVLLACALKTGAIIGGADKADANALYNFGINIGLAFQLKDDLLDVYGDEATFGKKIGGDILCNKKTYMLIQALNKADATKLETFKKWLGNHADPDEKIASVTALYNEMGIKEICENKMNFYYQKGITELNKISIDTKKKAELKKIAEKLMSRND